MTPRREGPAGAGPSDVRQRHIPVLLSEVLTALAPEAGGRIIDATFGAGGYTRAILDAAECSVLALDRDPAAIAGGSSLAARMGGRLELAMIPFAQLLDLAEDPETSAGYAHRFDGVVFDLGVSSMQLDEPERGFSFQNDGPLDMRMFATAAHASGMMAGEGGPSAADLVNSLEEEQLADIIFRYGDERRSRAIARAIVRRRAERAFERTLDLADVVSRALGGRRHDQKQHPATRTFQALRIAVNDELGQLRRGLAGAERCLKPGGRLVVVTFHSLEDRIVKRFIAERSGKEVRGSRHLPERPIELSEPSFQIVNRRPLTSSKGEIDVNPRSRSARLRAAVRTSEPSWPVPQSDIDDPLNDND